MRYVSGNVGDLSDWEFGYGRVENAKIGVAFSEALQASMPDIPASVCFEDGQVKFRFHLSTDEGAENQIVFSDSLDEAVEWQIDADYDKPEKLLKLANDFERLAARLRDYCASEAKET